MKSYYERIKEYKEAYKELVTASTLEQYTKSKIRYEKASEKIMYNDKSRYQQEAEKELEFGTN